MSAVKRKYHITLTLRGFNGRGWEMSVTGDKNWVEKMIKKFTPLIQRATQRSIINNEI